MDDLELTRALLDREPYFGPAFLASSGVQAAWAIPQIIQCAEKERPFRVLVLGCWLGAVLPALREALATRPPGSQVTCVDDFHAPASIKAFPSMKGPTWMEKYLAKAQENGVLCSLLQHNLRALDGETVFRFHEQNAMNFLKDNSGEHWDVIYIGGEQIVPGFKEVFVAAKDLLAANGILCGTGYCHKPEAADEFGVEFAIQHGRIHVQGSKDTWHYPEISKVLSQRFPGMVSTHGIWALHSRKGVLEPMELIAPNMPVSDCGKVSEYSIYKTDNGYLVLHDSIPETSLYSERLGEREIPELLYHAGDTENAFDIALHANERLQRRKTCRIGQTTHYNVLRCGDRFVAMLRYVSDSPIHLFEEVLGERELRPSVLTGDTEEEVRQKIADCEAGLTAVSEPLQVIEDYMGYSLYGLSEGRILAVSHRLGRIRPFKDLLGAVEIYPGILRADNRDAMLRRIQDVMDPRFQALEPGQQGWR